MPQPFPSLPLFISQTGLLTLPSQQAKYLENKNKVYNRKNYTARDFFLLLRNVFVSMSKMFSRNEREKKMKICVIYFASAHYGFGVFHLVALSKDDDDERETCIHNHQHPSIFNGVFHAFYLPFESIIHNNFQFHMRRGSSWGRAFFSKKKN